MICKNCGNEIRTGNNFCTKCGKKVNEKNQEQTKVKFKYIIIGIILIVMTCITIIIFKLINNSKDLKNTAETKNTEEQNIYVTQNTVPTQNEVIKNEQKNFLDKIYEKYPELKKKEGFICTNGTEYWILNNHGEKVYFNDLESFEKAIKESEIEINNVEENNSKETSQEGIQNNNQNNNQNTIQNEQQVSNENIYINNSMLEGKNEEEITNFLKQKGLKVKINKKNETIPYPDEKAGKTIATLNGDVGGYHYEKGSLIEVNYTYYKPVEWKINIEMKVSETYFTYNNENCYIYNPVGLYRYCCYNTNPNNISQDDLINSQTGRGVKCYINNNYIGDVIDGDIPYTFENNENLTLKIVAPFIYDFKERKILGTDVIVYDKTYNIKELYKNKNSDYIRPALPSLY